ncbi:hypothetical protein ACQKD4_02090 [Exiguobacterium sp. NPDC077395]|uniref:hypothetical protein n=1 Tax=Exiguobacterium sp. NPDC077395 TaxID=3390563 RepID=UPI003D03DFE3
MTQKEMDQINREIEKELLETEKDLRLSEAESEIRSVKQSIFDWLMIMILIIIICSNIALFYYRAL